MFGIAELEHAIWELIAEIRLLREEIEKFRERLEIPPNPVGKFVATQLGEVKMGIQVRLEIPTLPPAPEDDPDANHDIINGGYGLVTLTYDGVDQEGIQTGVVVAPDPALTMVVVVPKGITLGGRFVFVDDDANQSLVPLMLVEQLTADKELPPNPIGTFGATQIGEVPD